jgi:hypothetical protein
VKHSKNTAKSVIVKVWKCDIEDQDQEIYSNRVVRKVTNLPPTKKLFIKDQVCINYCATNREILLFLKATFM